VEYVIYGNQVFGYSSDNATQNYNGIQVIVHFNPKCARWLWFLAVFGENADTVDLAVVCENKSKMFLSWTHTKLR
jgi:hypothetical protein